MSYILDALKKSDQQRQRGVTPTLLTAQAMVTEPKRPKLLLASVFAVILIFTGMVIGWLRPWQHLQPVSVPESNSMEPSTSDLPLAATGPAPALPEMAGKPERLMQESASGTPPAAPGEPAIPVADKTAQMSAAEAGQGKEVMALHELPASIQREIPNISISFHIYSSKPKDRRVMINGEMAGQGDLLAPGLGIEQITPDGVILGYKGYRFRRGFR